MDKYHKLYLRDEPDRNIVWAEIARYIKQFIPGRKTVLELGASYCNFINAAEFGKKVAIDIWPEFTKYAHKDVYCRVYDVRRGIGKILKTKFDLILASNLLEHLTLEEAIDLLADCRKLLTDNGRLVLIQPNFATSWKHYFDDYTHKTIFTDKSLRFILEENGFKIVHAKSRFLPLTFKSKLPKWRFLVKLYLTLPIKPLAGQMLFIVSK